MKLSLIGLSGVLVALLCSSSAPAAQEPIQASEALGDGFQCYVRCNDCRHRCKSGDRSCEENCFDSSANCCEANGKKPIYKMCGCN